MEKAKIFAMLFPLGTLESTRATGWTWTLIAHLDMVKQAGVEFDPEARTLTSVQGIASSGSALQVRVPTLAYPCKILLHCLQHITCTFPILGVMHHLPQTTKTLS